MSACIEMRECISTHSRYLKVRSASSLAKNPVKVEHILTDLYMYTHYYQQYKPRPYKPF